MSDAVGFHEVDRWEGGVGWLEDPDGTLRRTSHALAVDGEVWVVDPVDVPDLDDRLSDLGKVAGVVLCLDRHKRDSAAVATRHDVPVHLPRPLAGVADALEAPTAIVGDELADTGYRTHALVDNRFWTEVALHHPGNGTLLVPEAVGTAPHYVVGNERLGVHPALRLRPPRRVLAGYEPERVLVGHGSGVHVDAAEALEYALRTARRNAPRLYWKALTGLAGGG